MRPWMIVLSSAIGAIVVAAALAVPELLNAPGSDFGSILLLHLATLAVAALAVYALCAMLLTAGTLIADSLFVRHRLGSPGAYRTLGQRDWTAAFGSVGLQRLVPRPIAAPSRRAEANETIPLQSRFDPHAARGEIARLYYIWLARTHFFSASIVLSALIGLGLAQDHGPVPLPGAIPTTSAILTLVGLILLAFLGRIAIDVSVEPLVETISQLPAEPIEVGFLRRAVETLEAACAAAAVYAGPPASTVQLAPRLDAVIEEGHRALLDAVRRLATTIDALEKTTRSSVDALKTAIGAMATQLPPIQDNADADASSFAELRVAVEALTATIERLTTLPVTPDEPTLGAAPAARERSRERPLARELRNLLQEIEAS